MAKSRKEIESILDDEELVESISVDEDEDDDSSREPASKQKKEKSKDKAKDKPKDKPKAKSKKKKVSPYSEPSRPASKKKKKKKNKKKEFKVFDKASVLFYLMSFVACLALLTLAVNILMPETFRKVFYSTPIDRSGTVMTIGNYKVSSEEYVNSFLTFNDYVNSNYGNDYLKQNPSEEESALKYVEDDLIQKYIRLQWAEDLGIVLSDADKASVDAAINQTIESIGGYEEFLRALDSQYLTVDLYYKLAYQQKQLNMLEDELSEGEFGETSDEDVQAYLEEEGIVSAKHILIATTGDKAEDAKKLELAESILKQLQNGADFDKLMNQYTEDPGLEHYPDGYTFGPGEMVDEFYDGTIALEVGEISEIIKSTHGYHIIMRTETNLDDYRDTVRNQRFDEKIEELKENVTITYGRGFKYISIYDIHWDHKYPQHDVAELPPPSGIVTSGTGEEDHDPETCDDPTHDHSGEETTE